MHPSASRPRPKRLRPRTVVLPTSATRSTRRPRSQRPPATTNAEPSKSNTLLLNRRPSAAKRHRRPIPHQRLAPPNECLSKPPMRLQMATNRPPARDLLVLPAVQQLRHRSDQVVSLRDQYRTTLPSALRPRQQHGRQRAVRLVDRECRREATRTRNRRQLLWLPRTPKVVSRNPRRRTTLSLLHTLNRSLWQWASQALGNQVLSGSSRLKLDLLADIPRVATSARTPLQRRLAV